MSHGKQFTFYNTKLGPNGWKVGFLFEELGLSYETVFVNVDGGDNKKSPFVDLNPNGRIPAIVDHLNNDFVIWESDAILLYIIETYDKEGRFSYTDPNDRYRQVQWLFFQASGQGPYYGQAAHFIAYHPKPVPTAIKRYYDEVKRVMGVLDTVLSKQDWLVGGKFGIADMAMFPWHALAVHHFFPEGSFDFAEKIPHVHAWYLRMKERPSVKKVWAEYEGYLAEVNYDERYAEPRSHFKSLISA
ncbi:glutathione S-transferase [Heliocybe sulcata]|uniref:glutathione transferase n=1 Tax=Heliocybe sulcata TaxID=5364 RepID=A0A5C3MXB4_9AGAM|nr:glutathione S-transferase [Heliocybe sulcata]